MPLQFYKPTQNTTGCACSLSFNSKEHSLFLNMVKQTGWNATSKTGSFKGGKKVVVKFGVHEIGGFIDTIEKGRVSSGYHKHPSGTQSIQFKFAPYYSGKDDAKFLKGFSLSVIRGDLEDSSAPKETYGIGFTFGEAVAIREYLRFTLGHIYTAIYSADKQAFADSQASKNPDEPAAEKPARKPRAKKEETAPQPSTAKVEADPFADDSFITGDGTVEASEKIDAEKTDKPVETTENVSSTSGDDDDVF